MTLRLPSVFCVDTLTTPPPEVYALPADHRVSEIVENVERNLHVLTGHAKWLAQLMIGLDERVNALSGNMAHVLRVLNPASSDSSTAFAAGAAPHPPSTPAGFGAPRFFGGQPNAPSVSTRPLP